ncbi:hypothetical protein CDD81_1082 [Ophiocordyceps australis]|uniref:DUF6606 domain-containing protein n=1 Tax=Ophiocordyceps australis TaxID=1399860 RepID=A0A2C5XWQ3_9HYPO|nr:hypothetical protein CDD81_1082 [Ophiocordyceps australis]
MTTAPPLEFSQAGIQYAVEHVFLPPKLPQKSDTQAITHESSLLAAVSSSLELFRDHVDPEYQDVVHIAQLITVRFQKLRNLDGFISEDLLKEAFQVLETDDILPIQVAAQNAGIIITRKLNHVVFEPFELSPDNHSVMSTMGRLKRRFPASSVAIDLEIFQEADLQSALANTISKMSFQEVAEMKPKVKKAGETHIEERDTTHPRVVTEFLATVLHAIGRLEEGTSIIFIVAVCQGDASALFFAFGPFPDNI